jgi:hypothetical protein
VITSYIKKAGKFPQNYLNRRLHMENQYCKDSESNNNVTVCAGLVGQGNPELIMKCLPEPAWRSELQLWIRVLWVRLVPLMGDFGMFGLYGGNNKQSKSRAGSVPVICLTYTTATLPALPLPLSLDRV